MKATISCILLCLTLVAALPADARKNSRKQQPIVLTTDTTIHVDSLSGIRLAFPPGAMAVRDSVHFITLKYADTHYVTAYTWHNTKDEPYDWYALSNLDTESFDNIVSQTRVEGEKRDGWHRLYHFPTANPPHYLLTTIIRGNRDAMMMLETTTDTTRFITRSILEASTIPSYTLKPTISSDTAWKIGLGWVVAIMVIIWYCKMKLRKKNGFMWGLVAANYIVGFLVCYFMLNFEFGTSASHALLLSVLPALYVISGGWEALFKNILNNIG